MMDTELIDRACELARALRFVDHVDVEVVAGRVIASIGDAHGVREVRGGGDTFEEALESLIDSAEHVARGADENDAECDLAWELALAARRAG